MQHNSCFPESTQYDCNTIIIFQTEYNTIAIQLLYPRLNIIQLQYNHCFFKTEFGGVNFGANLEENLDNWPNDYLKTKPRPCLICTTTAKTRQDWGQGKPEYNHSPAKAKSRPRLGEAYEQPHGNFMTWELHGTSSEHHGRARGLYGTSWELHGIYGNSMKPSRN